MVTGRPRIPKRCSNYTLEIWSTLPQVLTNLVKTVQRGSAASETPSWLTGQTYRKSSNIYANYKMLINCVKYFKLAYLGRLQRIASLRGLTQKRAGATQSDSSQDYPSWRWRVRFASSCRPGPAITYAAVVRPLPAKALKSLGRQVRTVCLVGRST